MACAYLIVCRDLVPRLMARGRALYVEAALRWFQWALQLLARRSLLGDVPPEERKFCLEALRAVRLEGDDVVSADGSFFFIWAP